MNPSASVNAVEDIAGFQAALLTFADRAKEALGSVEMELRRMGEWLDAQGKHWHAEKRRADDAVIAARIELDRKKMMRIGGRQPDTIEEEKALRRALARFEYAEEMLGRTKHWQNAFPEALLEYHGPAHQLQFLVEGQVPQMSALLSRKIAALEQYQELP